MRVSIFSRNDHQNKALCGSWCTRVQIRTQPPVPSDRLILTGVKLGTCITGIGSDIGGLLCSAQLYACWQLLLPLKPSSAGTARTAMSACSSALPSSRQTLLGRPSRRSSYLLLPRISLRDFRNFRQSPPLSWSSSYPDSRISSPRLPVSHSLPRISSGPRPSNNRAGGCRLRQTALQNPVSSMASNPLRGVACRRS